MSDYPGFYAVPGSAWPGSIWPGDPAPAPVPPSSWVFTGDVTLTYLQYLDTGTMRTLTAQPGGTYSIEVASGQAELLMVPPADSRWIAGD